MTALAEMTLYYFVTTMTQESSVFQVSGNDELVDIVRFPNINSLWKRVPIPVSILLAYESCDFVYMCSSVYSNMMECMTKKSL